jgi:hypothetical protein
MFLSPSLGHMNFSREVSVERTPSPKFGSKCINNLFYFILVFCIFTSLRISFEELILIPSHISHTCLEPLNAKGKKIVQKFAIHYIKKFNPIPYGKPLGVHHPFSTHLHEYEKKINMCNTLTCAFSYSYYSY